MNRSRLLVLGLQMPMSLLGLIGIRALVAGALRLCLTLAGVVVGLKLVTDLAIPGRATSRTDYAWVA